jgi:hypothetical protein
MADFLKTQLNLSISAKIVDQKLEEIATQLRDYRIYVRGGKFPIKPIELDEKIDQLIDIKYSEKDDYQEEFLEQYRQQFMACLDATILQVTEQRCKQFKRKSLEKSEQFLKALSLFHCRGESMGEIAKKLGLKAQYQVTRLLNLKEFRADVRQQLLIQLRDRILEFAKNYTDTQSLKNIDQKVEEALDEQINQIIQEAESESHNSQDNSTKSLFSQRLCKQLDCQFNC